MMLRTLDAEIAGEIVVGAAAAGSGNKAVTLNADQTWKQYEIDWTVTGDSVGTALIYVSFVTTAAAERKIGVDRVTLTITRP